LTEEELQALVAGAQWVSRQADDALALAAQNTLAKIGGVLPSDMQRMLDEDALSITRKKEDTSGLDLARVRQAIREQCKMRISYTGQAGAASERVIWPIMLGFVESRRFVAGWCELRQVDRERHRCSSAWAALAHLVADFRHRGPTALSRYEIQLIDLFDQMGCELLHGRRRRVAQIGKRQER
jgi:hypothetical protein